MSMSIGRGVRLEVRSFLAAVLNPALEAAAACAQLPADGRNRDDRNELERETQIVRLHGLRGRERSGEVARVNAKSVSQYDAARRKHEFHRNREDGYHDDAG